MRLAARQRSRGFTLIDVVVVIVVMGVMAATITTLAGRMAEQSARTLKTRQMLVVAQSLLEEIKHLPFNNCETVGTPVCAGADGPNAESNEHRFLPVGPLTRYDNVTDYGSGLGCAGLCDINGTVFNPAGISTLDGCTAAVLQTLVAMNGIPAAQVLRIRVMVQCPDTDPLYVEGIRVRHAPNNF